MQKWKWNPITCNPGQYWMWAKSYRAIISDEYLLARKWNPTTCNPGNDTDECEQKCQADATWGRNQCKRNSSSTPLQHLLATSRCYMGEKMAKCNPELNISNTVWEQTAGYKKMDFNCRLLTNIHSSKYHHQEAQKSRGFEFQKWICWVRFQEPYATTKLKDLVASLPSTISVRT